MLNETIKVLMRRDKITEAEATELFQETLQEMEEVGFDYEECQDILQNNLGLEPDYFMDFIS